MRGALHQPFLDLALKGLPNPNIQFALGINRPLYFSVHSDWADVAPDGGALIHAAKYLGPEKVKDVRSVQHELESMVDVLQPGWRTRVVKQRFLSDLTVSHALPLAKKGGLNGRPSVNETGFSGIYIIGDWVGNEGMLTDAAMSSAKSAAMQILSTKELRMKAAAV
jgi:phytoene dehydrogenase-like protein